MCIYQIPALLIDIAHLHYIDALVHPCAGKSSTLLHVLHRWMGSVKGAFNFTSDMLGQQRYYQPFLCLVSCATLQGEAAKFNPLVYFSMCIHSFRYIHWALCATMISEKLIEIELFQQLFFVMTEVTTVYIALVSKNFMLRKRNKSTCLFRFPEQF